MYLLVLGLCLFSTNSATVTDQEYDSMPDLFQFDDFNKCLFHNGSNIYCMATIQLRPANPRNFTQIWKIIEEVSAHPYNYQHGVLRHGICLSISNETALERVELLYEEKYKYLGLAGEVIEIRCEGAKWDYGHDKSEIVVGVVLIFYVVFVIFVTVGLQFIRNKSPTKYKELLKTIVGQFLVSFSITQNWDLITKTNVKDYSGFIPSMQGIRFLATLYVIAIHAGVEAMAIPVWNPRYIEQFPTRFMGTFPGFAGVFVQTFFVLSAWLLVIHVLKQLEKSGNISFGYIVFYIVTRYFRLVPFLAVMTALQSTLLVHTGRGPFWDLVMGEEYRKCRNKWWQNVLFINNFFADDGLCLVQSWYLSADFQLFVVFALMLWMIQKKIHLLNYISAGLNAVHILAMFSILFINNWELAVVPNGKVAYNFEITSTPQFKAFWISTYSCIPGYTMGAIFAYIYWKTKDRKLFPKPYQGTMSVYLTLFLIFGHTAIYAWYMSSNFYSPNRWLSAIYGSISKTLFAAGIALAFPVMTEGNGGILKNFFEHPFCHIMAQFSFGAYIIHFTVILHRTASRLSPPHLTDQFFMVEALAFMGISYVLSLILTLFIQMPFTVLSKKIMSLSN